MAVVASRGERERAIAAKAVVDRPRLGPGYLNKPSDWVEEGEEEAEEAGTGEHGEGREEGSSGL